MYNSLAACFHTRPYVQMILTHHYSLCTQRRLFYLSNNEVFWLINTLHSEIDTVLYNISVYTQWSLVITMSDILKYCLVEYLLEQMETYKMLSICTLKEIRYATDPALRGMRIDGS